VKSDTVFAPEVASKPGAVVLASTEEIIERKLRIKRIVEIERSYIEKVVTAELTQSSKALIGIRITNSFLPVIFILLAIIMILFYPLTTEKMKEIETELKSRKEKEEKE
jgi:Na+/melibiose symporter-like transporter